MAGTGVAAGLGASALVASLRASSAANKVLSLGALLTTVFLISGADAAVAFGLSSVFAVAAMAAAEVPTPTGCFTAGG